MCFWLTYVSFCHSHRIAFDFIPSECSSFHLICFGKFYLHLLFKTVKAITINGSKWIETVDMYMCVCVCVVQIYNGLYMRRITKMRPTHIWWLKLRQSSVVVAAATVKDTLSFIQFTEPKIKKQKKHAIKFCRLLKRTLHDNTTAIFAMEWCSYANYVLKQ